MPDGRGGMKSYEHRAQFELIVMGRDNNLLFEQRVGFTGRKQHRLRQSIQEYEGGRLQPQKYTSQVKSIEPDGREDVYCLNEPETHTIVVSAVVTGNCGEVPMAHADCCCLGSIVLPTHVKDGEIDWDMLDDTVRLGVRFLDNVLTRNVYPMPIIQETAEKHRRIGLGVMGLHDLLLEMGLKYSGKKALEIIDELMNFIKRRAYDASIFLAVEKGPFPLLDREKFLASGFCRKSLPPTARRKIREYGIRNCALLTMAPTGCQAEGSLVVTSHGVLRLNEIVRKDGDKWQPLDLFVQQESRWTKADKGFVNGRSPTKRITLHSGLTLESTPDHRFRVIRGAEYRWIRADELMIGDLLPCKVGGYDVRTYATTDTTPHAGESTGVRQLSGIKYPPVLTEVLAWIIGCMFGDASVHKKGIRIHCHAEDGEHQNTICGMMYYLFGIYPVRENGKGKLVSLCYHSMELLHFLDLNGLLKPHSPDVSIPRLVRESPASVIGAFIDGYWAADGSETNNIRSITTCSPQMAQDLGVCQRAIGQNIKIETILPRDGHYGIRPMYRVRYVGYGSVGFNKLRHINRGTRVDLDIVTKLAGPYCVPDHVVKIEDSEAITLDLSVPEGECYVANSVVSHNTTSIVAGVSSGVEPIFAPVYKRRFNRHKDQHDEQREKAEVIVVHPLLERFLREGRSVVHFEGAHDITPAQHCEVQATCQAHVDNSISKTINLPEASCAADLGTVLKAYIPRLKGITVYRDGSRGKSPIEPLPVGEAKRYLDQLTVQASVIECPSGACPV